MRPTHITLDCTLRIVIPRSPSHVRCLFTRRRISGFAPNASPLTVQHCAAVLFGQCSVSSVVDSRLNADNSSLGDVALGQSARAHASPNPWLPKETTRLES